jgi:diguanylate cyclase (GGDEF)-like protein/PAS domain S-box-containing protein
MSTKPAHLSAISTGLAFAALGAIAIRITPMGTGLTFLWPSGALLVARMAQRPPREWGLLLAACMIALGTLLAAEGVHLRAIGWLLAANLVESLLAAALMRGLLGIGTPRPLRSEEIGWLMRVIFCVSLIPTVAGGLIVWGGITHFSHPGWMLARDWFLGHALGLMILLPCFARMQRLHQTHRSLTELIGGPWTREDVAALGFPALMTATAILSFAMSTRPLLFLPVLVLVSAMLWVELFTLTAMYLILAAIAASMTIRGFSPLALMHVSMPQQLSSAQVYLLSTIACVTPISGLVHQLRRSLGDLRESEARYRLLSDHSTDIIMSSELDGRIRFVSPSVMALAQRQPEQVIGHNALLLVDPQHRRRVTEAHRRAIACPGITVVAEFAGMPQPGTTRWFEAHLRAVADDRGMAECVVSVIRDMSERKRVESALTEAAFTDPLTGLPNRRALMEAMAACLADGRKGCVAVIDLDHFKQVNDRYGHSAGDEVLRSFARVARQGLRATDMLARIGGEEFALLLPGADIDIGERICQRIGATLARTVTRHGDLSITVTSSMGLASLCADPCAAIDAADKALYVAKARGRDRLQVAA